MEWGINCHSYRHIVVVVAVVQRTMKWAGGVATRTTSLSRQRKGAFDPARPVVVDSSAAVAAWTIHFHLLARRGNEVANAAAPPPKPRRDREVLEIGPRGTTPVTGNGVVETLDCTWPDRGVERTCPW